MPSRYLKYENPADDRRRKLTNEEHDTIRAWYASGGVTQKEIAAQYGVSRSLITLICNPERAAKVAERIKENWRQYSDREALTKATNKLRQRKRELGLVVKDRRKK
jgi:transposase-like protein